ncbi:MAG TPA: hypothetical protein VH413_08600 [Verrucomicrobiae bacterium]|jgi:hypothetical protein|nr:hypothetical protein [Verrucomicrobiae bacterium]
MKQPNTLKHFAAAFLIAVAVYVAFYYGIEHRRTRHGPWQLTFTNESNIPTLIINEPQLNIADQKIIFPGEISTNSASLDFAQPQEWPFDVPFGQCIFEDTTFLPGTLVFKFFGHEVQLLPRVLTLDRREYTWQSHTTVTLNKANTSPAAP